MSYRYSDSIYGTLHGYTMCPYGEGTNADGQKPTETSVTEFYYESVNSSLEELINF